MSAPHLLPASSSFNEDAAVSWDISIMDLPADAHSVSDIPHDFAPAPLGQRAALIAKILEIAPQADFSDSTWGELSTPDFTIEFNMGTDALVDSLMLHVRGGDSAVDFITALLHHLGLRAIDCSKGDFFEPSAAVQSLTAWRHFRDRVIDGN
jgi:hypothetical protein